MGKGSYIGGHTIIGPHSGWFSFSVPERKARKRRQKVQSDSPAPTATAATIKGNQTEGGPKSFAPKKKMSARRLAHEQRVKEQTAAKAARKASHEVLVAAAREKRRERREKAQALSTTRMADSTHRAKMEAKVLNRQTQRMKGVIVIKKGVSRVSRLHSQNADLNKGHFVAMAKPGGKTSGGKQ
jgi:hypothetical protein